MRGREMRGTVPEAIRLYVFCENTNWSHLPLAGGIYDQHPRLIDQLEMIFRRVNRKRAEDQDKAKREAEASRRRGKR